MISSTRFFLGMCIVLSVTWIVLTITRYIQYRKEWAKIDRKRLSFWEQNITYSQSFWYPSLTAVMVFLALFWCSALVGALL